MPKKRIDSSAPTIQDEADPTSRDLTNYVSTQPAAEMLGVGEEHIRKLLERGRVKSIKIRRDWMVFVPSLEKYRETKSPKGLPPSKASQQKARS